MTTRQKGAAARGPSPECVVLGALALQPAHGYELHQRLAADLGHLWRLSQSQVYAVLGRLEQRGLIAPVAQPQEKLPDRRCYHLTAAGRRRFEAWLHAPSRGGLRAIRLDLVSRLYFAHALAPETLPALLRAQAAEVEQTLAGLRAALAAIPPEQPFNRMAVELRIRHLSVTLEWLAERAAALARDA